MSKNSPLSISESLSAAFDPKRNAFAFLRCVLAGLVIISHCYPIGGFGADPLKAITRSDQTLGVFAVAMFFVLSGFLITRASANSPSVGRFIWHRFLRIFPGYWVCLIACALVIAPLVCLFEHGVILPLFSTVDAPQNFVAGNLLLFHITAPSLPGVVSTYPNAIGDLFQSNPYQYAFNGSLWTLPFEWFFYLVVAAIAALCLPSFRRRMLLALFVILWTLSAFKCLWQTEFWQCFPYQGFGDLLMLSENFTAGSLAYLYRREILFKRELLIAAAAALLASTVTGCFGLVAPVAIPYAFLWLACKLPIRRFDAHGDFSYGLYIYAFPLQQVLALLNVQAGGFVLFAICSVILTGVIAVLSFKFVEEPCLRLKTMRPPFGRATIRTAPAALPVPSAEMEAY